MELHNTVEDIVIAGVDEVFEVFRKQGDAGNFCTCNQCRMDITCYVLNRTPPHYIVSNRGASRVQWKSLERQQLEADIKSLIHEGFIRVSHNKRPDFAHGGGAGETGADSKLPVFNIPTIMGRVFNGENFAPLDGADVELLRDGQLVAMKDGNWQNPYRLVSNTEGNFSFWPAEVTAARGNEHRIFGYSLRVSAPEFEPLVHFFNVPVASDIQPAGSFALNRTFKLPDLYIFPPGEAEKNG